MIRFLEQNGYDVSYTSDADLDRNGALLLNHKMFISSGHDEYWSAGERANVEAARDAGRQPRVLQRQRDLLEDALGSEHDGSNTPYRTLITYKETHFNAPTDPQDPPTWTGAWRDPRFSPPADGGQPAERADRAAVRRQLRDARHPGPVAVRQAAVLAQHRGRQAVAGPDADARRRARDARLRVGRGRRQRLPARRASSTCPRRRYGVAGRSPTTAARTGNGTATHHLTLYRAPSGALVFGAGTVQWAWGLDNTNAWSSGDTDPSGNPPDPNMQQATVNLFADMGAQPATLMSGLVAGDRSRPTPPRRPRRSPRRPPARTSQDGSQVTITGTATDAGGGVVAGVEVSTDGGSTWHPATITGADGTPSAGPTRGSRTATRRRRSSPAPSTTAATSRRPSDGRLGQRRLPLLDLGHDARRRRRGLGRHQRDRGRHEVQVRHVRHGQRASASTRRPRTPAPTSAACGRSTVSCWPRRRSPARRLGLAAGQLLHPGPDQPEHDYVSSYFAPDGPLRGDRRLLLSHPAPAPIGGSTVDSPPLHAMRSADPSVNGVYTYGSRQHVPHEHATTRSNYWVDVVFSPAAATGPGHGRQRRPRATASAQRHVDRADDAAAR